MFICFPDYTHSTIPCLARVSITDIRTESSVESSAACPTRRGFEAADFVTFFVDIQSDIPMMYVHELASW